MWKLGMFYSWFTNIQKSCTDYTSCRRLDDARSGLSTLTINRKTFQAIIKDGHARV